MTRVLKSKRTEPKSGDIRSVLVFLHGYGANGDDLLGLAEPLSEHLPDTLFVSPDAPENCAGSPMGFQWFPIPWIDGSSEEESKKGMISAVDDLNAFLDALMVDEDILPEQLALFGFSQGAMMALHVAPRREDPIAGVVAIYYDWPHTSLNHRPHSRSPNCQMNPICARRTSNPSFHTPTSDRSQVEVPPNPKMIRSPLS